MSTLNVILRDKLVLSEESSIFENMTLVLYGSETTKLSFFIVGQFSECIIFR